MNEQRKVAIVTGAGSGIGKAVALALLDAGYRVGARRAPRATRSMRRCAPRASARRRTCCRSSPTSAIPIRSRRCSHAVARTLRPARPAVQQRRHRRAGGAARGPDGRASGSAVVDTNLTGAFLCTQQAFRMMKAQTPRGGRIINNGSISAHAPRPNSAPYTATKHAITGLTKSTSLDGRKYDIACGQIDIGNAATEMAARMADRRAAGQRRDRRRAADGRRARRQRGCSTWRACRSTPTCSS